MFEDKKLQDESDLPESACIFLMSRTGIRIRHRIVRSVLCERIIHSDYVSAARAGTHTGAMSHTGAVSHAGTAVHGRTPAEGAHAPGMEEASHIPGSKESAHTPKHHTPYKITCYNH